MTLTTGTLSPETWPAFERLVERHNGIWGGCWCISFHLRPGENKQGAAAYRRMKRTLVREGRAQASLVFDGEDLVGWCQFGRTAELPNIKRQKAYEAARKALPDWRITCFFVDRERRGEGVSNLALESALQEIARLGGGRVEAYPEDVRGRKTSSSFLYAGTLGMFERLGFQRERKIGMHHWVAWKVVAPSRPARGTAGVPRPAKARRGAAS